jgi:hypothetical protein
MTEARFDYAGPFMTAERANDVLEDLIASDQMSPHEAQIDRRAHKTASWSKSHTRYYITTPM